MDKNLEFKQAVQLFSSDKKTLKFIDKLFDKQKYEYIVKAQDKDTFSIYSPDDSIPICVADDILKVFKGVLFFEFGVGRQDNMPSWAMHSGYTEETWHSLTEQLNSNQNSQFESINQALNMGSTLYCSNTTSANGNSFVLTNPFNASFADKIAITAKTFSDGMSEIDSLAQLCLNGQEQNA